MTSLVTSLMTSLPTCMHELHTTWRGAVLLSLTHGARLPQVHARVVNSVAGQVDSMLRKAKKHTAQINQWQQVPSPAPPPPWPAPAPRARSTRVQM